MDNASIVSRNRALARQIVDARKRTVNDGKNTAKQEREVATQNKRREKQFRLSHGLLIAFLALIL